MGTFNVVTSCVEILVEFTLAFFRYIQVIRPVQYGELMSKIKQYYGLDLCMNLSNGEFFVPLNNQAELNMAIDMVDRSAHMRSLRVFLVRPADASSPTSPPPQSLRLFDNQSNVSTVHLHKILSLKTVVDWNLSVVKFIAARPWTSSTQGP